MLTILLIAASLQTLPELAPGTRYDPAIPTLSEVAGHDFGEEITPPRDVVRYFEALATAAPQRLRLVRYAESWEGRPLVYAAIGSPERIARLEEVKSGLARLADPRGLSTDEAAALVDELPVVTWLLHGVHGNEISSSGAAMALAYHLLAAVDDEVVETILRESIVLVDPMENPDGRARFVHQNRLARAASPDPEPTSAEHDEPWPGGRGNHYLFDMNRDWLAITQPETRGRVRTALEWSPQVVVDLHEMGGEESYYFAPPAQPLNPHIAPAQQAWLERFGRALAERFDERGFAYFNRETYDSFYPGYGETWPIFRGGIGMTFEQASARSLLYRRRGDGRLLRYADGVTRHFTAALTTVATAARHRRELLADFHAYRRSAVELGDDGPVREYLIAPGGDPPRAEHLARLLAAHGLEVERVAEPVTAGERTLAAGSHRVSLAQPDGRLARNLLDVEVQMSEAFVAEQDRRRKKRLPDEIYDLTGWSLPLLFDVEVVASDESSPQAGEPIAAEPERSPRELPAARVGYLIPWGVSSAAAVSEALREGITVRHFDGPFRHAGRDFAAGTVLVRRSDNGEDLRERLGRIAGRHGIEVVAADSGWVDSGISFGSSRVVALKPPRVLLGWDEPASRLSAGWARYVLERRYGQPVTIVRVASLGAVDLADYQVVVLPSGDYRRHLDADAVRRLRGWMSTGGTLVLLGEASRWAARESVGLLKTHTLLRDGTPEKDPDAADGEADASADAGTFDLEQALKPEQERPESTPGALLRVALDAEHWLSSGLDGEVQAIVEGRRVFAPIRLDDGRNVGLYRDEAQLVASGLAWPEAEKLLAQRAFLIHQPEGEGHLVAFAEDPNYRAFAEATQLLFMNAVLLGPAR